MDLFNDLQNLIKRLNTSIELLKKYGNDYAEAERDYKIVLRQEALKLRAEKGMAVTLINQVVYGVPEVANKRFKRDVNEAMYKTALENINSIKLQIRVLENQLDREYRN
jgi:ribosomal protein L31E